LTTTSYLYFYIAWYHWKQHLQICPSMWSRESGKTTGWTSSIGRYGNIWWPILFGYR